MIDTGDAMDLALWKKLSDEGFSLIPLHGKAPFEDDWQQWCLKKRIFNPQEFDSKNAGIACGPASEIIVLDEDDREKFKQFLEQNNFDLPETREHETGRGLIHRFYSYPLDGHEYGNRSFKKFGFDIRGLGGQVVAPGSIHPDNGKAYRILHDRPIAPCPQWILDYARRDNKDAGEHIGDEPIDENELVIDVSSLPIKKKGSSLFRMGNILKKVRVSDT
jgi:hypothetical protein